MKFPRLLLLPLVGFVSFVSSADTLSGDSIYIPGLKQSFSPESRITVILDAGTIDYELFADTDVRVECSLKDQHIVSLPAGKLKEFMETPGIGRVSLPRPATLDMNFSRPYTGVSKILAGDGISKNMPMNIGFGIAGGYPDIIPYTGEGVIIGVVDGGIDPTHITFLNTEMTETRVKKYILTTSAAESDSDGLSAEVFDSPYDVPEDKIDNTSGGHGTHVASIAGGAYQGNDFCGNAIGADLFFVSMGKDLYDDEIIYGMKSVADYAAEKGQPAVINFSLSNSLGPHDGTSSVCLAADAVSAPGVITCFSSGNSGNIPNALDFNSGIPVSFGLMGRDGVLPPSSFDVEMWSKDKGRFKVVLSLVRYGSKVSSLSTPAYTFPAEDIDKNENVMIISSREGVPADCPEWQEKLKGNIELKGGIDPVNGKFYISLSGSIFMPQGKEGYFPAITIIPEEDTAGTAYTSPSQCYIDNLGVSGFVSGTTDQSISDFCTTESVISVGMMNASPYNIDIDGHKYDLNTKTMGKLYAVNTFSSYLYQPEEDFRILPDVVAPGSIINAAYNSNAKYTPQYLSARALIDGKEYLWGINTGTSMSSPNMAGIIALWMEADPSLTVNDIRNVFKATCTRTPEMNTFPPKSAYGQVNAYDGLKYILENKTLISSPEFERTKTMIRFLSPRRIECVLTTKAEARDVILTAADGTAYSLGPGEGQVFEKNLPDVKGIYIISVKTDFGFTPATKLVLR